MEKYDLTKAKTLVDTASEMFKMGLLNGNPFSGNPIFALGKLALEKVFSTDSLEVQKETAEALIIRGKETGVDEMEITVKNRKGFALNIPLEDIKIDTVVGADDNLHVKVKYK